MWSRIVELPLPDDLHPLLIEALESFPPEHQAVGRALVALRRERGDGPKGIDNLLGALRVTSLPRLPPREETNGPDWSGLIIDASLTEAKVGAAERLLGVVEEATPFVVDFLRHAPASMYWRLHELLVQRGLRHFAEEVNQDLSRRMQRSMTGLSDLDTKAHMTLLHRLAAEAPADLSYQQATRLTELADFCETLQLNDILSRSLVSRQLQAVM